MTHPAPVQATPPPYYQDDSVTIYHGDCRDILPRLPRADAIVTDPPYGISCDYDQYKDTPAAWFSLMNDVVPLMRAQAQFVVMPACNRYEMRWWYNHHEPDWLIAWYKGSPGHRSPIGFNDWEPHLCWGRPARPMHDFFHTACGFDDNGHPCPKPLEYGEWLVSRAAPASGLIIDPFAGGGTTLRAAKNLGRNAIGIELSEAYCELAAVQVSQEVLFATQELGEREPRQEVLAL